MNRYLFPGDVFKIESGMKVITEVPEKYVFDNCMLSDERANHVVKVKEPFYFDSNKFKERRLMFVSEIAELTNSTFGYLPDKQKVNEAVSHFLSVPVPDSYDTSYLIGEYEVYSVERNRIRAHGSSHGCELRVEAFMINKPEIKIEFYQTGFSEALILPKHIELVVSNEFVGDD